MASTLEAYSRGDLDVEDLQSPVRRLIDGALSVAVLTRIGHRRLTGSGCSGYVTAIVTDRAGIDTALDDASIECIDITSDITLSSQIEIAADKVIRFATSTGAFLDGGGSTRIMYMNTGTDVDLEGLTFKNGYAVRMRPFMPFTSHAALPTVSV
jgi:hypothetical protein